MMKGNNIVGKKRQAVPALMNVHKIERMVFSAEHIHKEGIWIHISENNFKVIKIGKGKVYISSRMSEKKILELTNKVSKSYMILNYCFHNQLKHSFVHLLICPGRAKQEKYFMGHVSGSNRTADARNRL
jgi:hypothetical protein